MGYIKMTLKLEKGRKLSEFSTLGVGGPIDRFVQVSNADEMCEAFSLEGPVLVIGRGSNCLFSDEGFQGLVLLNKIDFCHWEKNLVTAGSGYSFSRLGAQSAKKNFSGLEFASGIPASVGGAIFMNAGANGRETCQVLESVEFFDGVSKKIFLKKELEFGYRESSFQTMRGVILAASFVLQKGLSAREDQLAMINHRVKTQPLTEKSIGCIFRNPGHMSAGALIDQAGLKGLRVGGAEVSLVHANFIVNKERASANDVKKLIHLVQERVFQQTGVFLEPEIRMIDDR